MEDLAADFIIENNEPLEFEAEISEPEHFDCSFELYAAGTTWGSISGTLSNQTDLQDALDLKADKSEVESVTGALADSITALDSVVSANYTTLSDSITALDSIVSTKASTSYVDSITGALNDSISGIDSIISGYGDIVTYNAADFATSIQGGKADTALQPNDNISELNNDVGYITSASLPTVNDGELTIKVNGSSIATFTANQGTDTIADITIPNAAEWGNITGTLSDQTDLQNALDAKVTNNATGTKALAVGNTSQSTAEGGVAVGYGARANSTYSTAVGEDTRATNTNTTVIGRAAKATEARAIAIGSGAEANAQDAIAIKGINNTANTFQVYTYNMLDMSTGLIPDARISSNIARTVDIPSLTNYVTTNTAQTISQTKAFSQPLVIADNNGLASGTLLSSKKILQRSSGDATLTLNNKDNKLRLVGSETRPQYSADGTNYSELALYSDVTAISDLIPSAATVSNQLADKDFVNSSIATNTANFIGTFNSVADLEAYSGTLTNNDYAFVVGTDAEGNTVYDRYKYTDATTPPSWIFEYELNNSSFTAAQWNAINSGITSGDVALIATALQSGDNVSALVNDAGYITSSALSGYATETWVGNQGYALASSLATVATSGDYTDLLNTPTIPTVDQTYDGTSANAQSGVAIAGAGFITSAALANYLQKDVAQSTTGTLTFVGQKKILFKQSAAADKLGFTLYNSSNTELGALEYRPNTISGKALLNINCPYAGDYVGFRYWGTAVNIIAPKVSTAGDYYIPTHITDGNTTVTASNTGSVNISSLLPDISTKQDTLVSGTNIKTISNTSLLGSGDIDPETQWHLLANLSAGSGGLTILGEPSTGMFAINIGAYSEANDGYSIAIGENAIANDISAIQIGHGTNSTANSLSVGFFDAGTNYTLLDGTTGLIPDARISTNIARTSAIPTALSDIAVSAGSNITISGDTISATDTTYSDYTGADSMTAGTSGLVPAPSAGDEDKILTGGGSWESANTVIGYTPANTDLSNLSATGEAHFQAPLGYTPVNKSGDTMTGDLSVVKDAPAIIMQNNNANADYTSTTSPSADIKFLDFSARDKNNNYTGGLSVRQNTANNFLAMLYARRKISGTEYSAYFNLYVDSSGGSHCSFPQTTCCDGQWVSSSQSIISSSTSLYNSGGSALPYRITLPNDGHNYEVLVMGRCITASTSGHFAMMFCNGNGDGATFGSYICGCRTRTSSYVDAWGSTIVVCKYVASGSNNLWLARTSNSNGDGKCEELNVVAYRRIGTNS